MNSGRTVFAIIVLAAGVNAQWLRFGKYDDDACTRLIHEQYIQTSSSGICTISDVLPAGSYKATKGAGDGGGGGGGEGTSKSLEIFTSTDCTGTGEGVYDEIVDTTCTRLDPGGASWVDEGDHAQYVKVLNWNAELPTMNAIIVKMYHGTEADADKCAADSVDGSHIYAVFPMGDESCVWNPDAGKYVKLTTCDASTGDYTRVTYSDNACAGTVDSTVSESIGDVGAVFENKVCSVEDDGSTGAGEYENANIDYCQDAPPPTPTPTPTPPLDPDTEPDPDTNTTSTTSPAPGHSNFFPVVSVAALLSLLAL